MSKPTVRKARKPSPRLRYHSRFNVVPQKDLVDALTAHHNLLERLRTSGDMKQEDAVEAVACLHMWNALVPNRT